jgi:hypothetical protein
MVSTSLPPEFRVIKHLMENRVLQDMVPCDITAYLDACPLLRGELALHIIVAWIKDPAAIKAFLENMPGQPHAPAPQLLHTLHQTRRAQFLARAEAHS